LRKPRSMQLKRLHVKEVFRLNVRWKES